MLLVKRNLRNCYCVGHLKGLGQNHRTDRNNSYFPRAGQEASPVGSVNSLLFLFSFSQSICQHTSRLNDTLLRRRSFSLQSGLSKGNLLCGSQAEEVNNGVAS